MESDLIQIYEEEDSLLQQVPKEDISRIIRNKTYFDCSPLQVPRSKSISQPPLCSPIVEVTSCIRNAETPSFSSLRNNINQDINYHKPEVLKLNVEPHQMKRKKKNGGCNLRKSLAWDRAFFTEEGVLDPLELSMISGSSSPSRIETLSVIHEDRSESSLSLECSSDSADLQALEGNLFKEISESSKKVACSSLSNNFSSVRDNMTLVSMAKRKVLSGHGVNKSDSKHSSCHRPIVSNSLKRPGNMNTTKTVNKELKVSKIPTFRPDPSVLASTAKRVVSGTSKLKQTQATRPVKNAQKLFGFKSSTSSTRSAQSDAKSGLESKSLISKSSFQRSTRTVSRTTSENYQSANSLGPLTKSKDSFNVTSDLKFSVAGRSSNDHGAGQPDVSVSFPQNACPSVASVHDTQLQTVKPSGLRMPSPSLGFFGQAKSTTQGSIRKGTQSSSCIPPSIPGIKKPGGIKALCERPQHAAEKVPKMVNDVRSIENMLVLNQRSALQDKIESRIRSTIPKLTLKDEYTQISFEPTNNQQQAQGIRNDANLSPPDHAEPNHENRFCPDYKEYQSNDKKVLVCGVPCSEEKKNEDYEATRNSDTSKKCRELSRFGTENACFTPHKSSEVQVKCVSGTDDLSDLQVLKEKQYGSLAENQKSITKLLSDRAILRNGKLERSNGLSCSEVEEQTNDGASDIEKDGAHIKRTNLAPSEELKSDNLTNLVKFDPSSGNGSELKGSASLCIMPQVNQGCGKLEHVDDSLPADHKYAQCELDRIASKLDTSNGFLNSVGESEGTHITCQLSRAIQVTGGSELNDINEYKDIDDKQCSLLVKNYFTTSDLKTEEGIHCFDQADLGPHANCLSDWQERTGQTMTSSLEVDKTSGEDNLREKEFSCPFTIGSIACQESANFIGGDTQDVEPNIKGESEDPHITCQLTPTTLIIGGSRINEITEYNKDTEATQCSLLVEKRYITSDLQNIEGIHCSDLAALGAPTNCLSNRQDVTGLTMPNSLEVGKTPPKNNRSPKELQDPFSNGSLVYQDSENFNSGDTQDAKTNILDAQERVVGSQIQHIEKGNEENAGAKVLVEIAELEFLNGSEKYLANSVVNNTTLRVIDHPGEQSKELPKLQTPGLLVEQVSMAYQGELFPINVQPEESQDGNTLGSISVVNNTTLRVIDHPGEQSKELPKLQTPGLLVEQVSMAYQGELFPINVQPEESQDGNTLGSIFISQQTPASQSNAAGVVEKAKNLLEDEVVARSAVTFTSRESNQFCSHINVRRDSKLITLVDPASMMEQVEQFASNVLHEGTCERITPGGSLNLSEKSDTHEIKSNNSVVCTSPDPSTHSVGDVIEKVEYLPESDFVPVTAEVGASDGNLKCHFGMKFRHDSEHSSDRLEQLSLCNSSEQLASNNLPEVLAGKIVLDSAVDIPEKSDPLGSELNSVCATTMLAPATHCRDEQVNEKAEYLNEDDLITDDVETHVSVKESDELSGVLVEQVSISGQGEQSASNIYHELQERNPTENSLVLSEHSDPSLSNFLTSTDFSILTLQTEIQSSDVNEKVEDVQENNMAVEKFKCPVDINFRYCSKPGGMVVDNQGQQFESNILLEELQDRINFKAETGDLNMNEKPEYLFKGGFVMGAVNTDVAVKSFGCHVEAQFKHESEHSGHLFEVEQVSMQNQGEQFSSSILQKEVQDRNAVENGDIIFEGDTGVVDMNGKAKYLLENNKITSGVETNMSSENVKVCAGVNFSPDRELAVGQASMHSLGNQLQDENAFESALDMSGCSAPCIIASYSSINSTLGTPAAETGSVEIQKKAEYLPKDNFFMEAVECNQSVVNFKCHVDANFGHVGELSSLQVEQVCMHNQSEQLGSNTLPKDVQENNSLESGPIISEHLDPCVSQSNCSMDSTLLIPVGETLVIDMSEKAEYIQEDENVTCTVEADAVENHKCQAAPKFSLDSDLVIEHVSICMEGEQFASYVPLKELPGKIALESAIPVTDIDPCAYQSGGVENLKSHVDINFKHDDDLSGLVAEQVRMHNQCEQFASNILLEAFQHRNYPGNAIDIFEQSYHYGNDSKSLVTCLSSSIKDGLVDVNEKVTHLHMDNFVVDSTDNGTLVDYHKCHDGKLSGQATYSGLDFPLKNKDQVSGDINTCSSKLLCSLNEESTFSTKSNHTLLNEDALQQTNFSGLKCGTLSTEAESNISPCRGVPKSEMQQESSPAMYISEDKQATTPLQVGSDNKSDTLSVKPPQDVVPFSDEWLAAFEAAGEEILTLKSGAVQNSPEQDALPEPGPWSPVKRKKHQAIGPFDCTKFSNQHSM